MSEVTVTKAGTPNGQCVWILRYVGGGDPIASLDGFESESMPGGHVRLECDPHLPDVRVYLVDGELDLPAEPTRNNTISMELKTALATIRSSDLKVSAEELDNIIALSKGYHQEGAVFEMWTDTGFVVVPPEVTKNSILTINIKTDDNEVQDI